MPIITAFQIGRKSTALGEGFPAVGVIPPAPAVVGAENPPGIPETAASGQRRPYSLSFR